MTQSPQYALELLKQFLQSMLTERDVPKAISYLSQTIVCSVLRDCDVVMGLKQAEALLHREFVSLQTAGRLTLLQESSQELSEHVHSVLIKFQLQIDEKQILCSVLANACPEDGVWKLCTLQIAIPPLAFSGGEGQIASDQLGSGQAMKNIKETVLNGGVLGVYRAPKLPLYCMDSVMLSYLGYESEQEFMEVTGGYLEGTIHQGDRQMVCATLERQLASGEAYEQIYRLLRKDGTVLWVESKGSRETTDTGVDTFISVCTDISRWKETELALLEKEMLYRTALQNSAVNVWKYDPPTQTLCHLFQVDDIYGRIPTVIPDVVNTSIVEGYVKQESIESFREMYQRLQAGEKELCYDIWLSKGVPNEWWCARIVYTNLFDSEGNFLYALGVSRNITNEIQTLSEKKQMELALYSTAIALWTYEIETGIFDGRNRGTEKIGLNGLIYGGYQGLIDAGYIMPESMEAYAELHRALERGEKCSTATIHFNASMVNIEWQKITYSTIFNEHGKPIIGVAIGEDVSELVHAQRRYSEELRSQELLQDKTLFAQFRVNLSQDMVEFYDLTAGADATLCEVKTHSDVVAVLASLCVEDEDLSRLHTLLNAQKLTERFLAGDRELSIEWQHKVKNGLLKWVKTHVRTYADPKNGDIMCFIYEIDIDEESTMRMIVERLIAVEYEMLGIITLSDENLRFVRRVPMHDDAEKAPVIAYQNSVDVFINSFISDENRAEAHEAMSLSTVCRQLEYRELYTCSFNMEKDGKEYRKTWEFTYLDHRKNRILFIRMDATPLFQTQEQQRQALKQALQQAQQASIAKSEFLSRMSHEIRTPMNAIIGMSALAIQAGHEPQQLSDYLSKMGVSARYLLSLINDILDMSRIESGKQTLRNEEFPFEEFISGINTIAYELAHEKGVFYDCVISSHTEHYYVGDSMKLKQVLINLLSNAIKFTNRGGNVQLIMTQKRLENGKAYLQFIVNDSGIGMSEEFLPRLFEPFEQEYSTSTTPYGGTGLGLAISKNLVDLMQGKISVISMEGRGTEFTIDVPLFLSDREHPELSREHALAWGQLSTLIVDDEITVCEHTKYILSELGMVAEWVDSGEKAVEKVQTKCDHHESYDLILIDWKMPYMDGIETSRQIRQMVGPEVTIIIMTAYDWPVLESEAKKAGVNLLISKPLFKSTLCSAFEQLYQNKEDDASAVSCVAVQYDFTGKRVLLVEDHVLNIEIAKGLLCAKGFEVQVAENGLIALECFSQAPPSYFDVILMDIRMPVMDGLTATSALRNLPHEDARGIPIIAMSANAFDEDIEKSKEAGMNAHLAKPIEPDFLYEILQRFLLQ